MPEEVAAKLPEEVPAKPLTYDVKREGETAVVKCHGRLVAGLTDGFYKELKEVASSSKVLVLDLEDLTYVDSMGLGTIVRLYAHAKGAGCEFQLLHLGKQLRNLLKMTNLLSTLASAEGHGINVA
ncbi:STAS domain-containing protein [Tunturibacter empetritectus]|uniref:Anti-sigma B factor antagonist n=1 Tax=Tunturiibacter lichenicola TaxID=2051959 RepID=A0A7W8N521_9BACT|nr:STAS domain-containing protein [Edaphobacter lichenicola]MBB5343520.1 anti-sigma B factor antagonist [Edaphobacter lichenicola]